MDANRVKSGAIECIEAYARSVVEVVDGQSVVSTSITVLYYIANFSSSVNEAVLFPSKEALLATL
jgi:hypothetical protein